MESIRASLRKELGISLRAVAPQDRLSAAWLVACGRVLARRGTIVGYSDGVVRVAVCGKWVEQLRSMRSQLEVELAQITGLKVTEIHFVLKG
jgi:hypothetical protein